MQASGDVLADALLAAQLLRRYPAGLGGIVLRGNGPARDAVLASLAPMLRMPVAIDDEALIGGRDLAALLAGERAAVRPGLLARADGGLIVVAMAERMPDAVAARLAAAMDIGEVVIERDGVNARHSARFGLVLLDDGKDDERVPDRLAERCAFRFDLSEVRAVQASPPRRDDSDPGLPPGEAVRSLAGAALAFGIASARAPMMALRAAHAIADLAARSAIGADDLTAAARLVFAHRATCLPAPAPAQDAPEPPPPPPGSDAQPNVGEMLEDVVLDAVRAALPPDMLAALAAGAGRRTGGGGAGERRRSPTRGRPLGARAGLPRGGARLALIDTLRAAVPWQRLRMGDRAPGARLPDTRIAIRKADIRIKRFETRAEATTIVAVDASGSAAAARLGEAKGAVELLLAEAYVKRTEIALIAFRGSSADVLLPPTRSLTRARRLLGDLPGGGGTPLGAGIDAARLLGEAVRAKGRTPFVVLLSDGRGNVATGGGTPADEANGAARRFGASGLSSVFIDISVRPRPEAAAIASTMHARYLALPRADAVALANAVKAIAA